MIAVLLLVAQFVLGACALFFGFGTFIFLIVPRAKASDACVFGAITLAFIVAITIVRGFA